MSFIDPHGKDQAIASYNFKHLELVLLDQWCNTLKLNKSIYSDASRYYSRLGNILAIIGGITKAIAGATVLMASLTNTFNIPQYVVTALTIAFIVTSTVISVIVDSMQFKPKSILYEETSRSCSFLINEIEFHCVKPNQSIEFASFATMIKSWNTMITSRAGKVPVRIVTNNIAKHSHINVVLEALKVKIKDSKLMSVEIK